MRKGAASKTRDGSALELIDQLAFERLLADLTARLADAAPGQAMAAVQHVLQRLVDFFGYDRCTYGEFRDDGRLNVLAAAAGAGIAPHPLGPFGEEKSWFLGELRAGRAIVLPDLPRGLPPEARAEAADIRRTGLRSHLSIPLRVRGRTTGVLAFAGFRAARDWPKEVVVRLTIVAELIATAVERARSEDEAEHLRTRLWHADRVARVGALAAAIAHEINQPLTAILSNAQAGLVALDRGEARPEALREILEAVVRDDKRAAETIRTMRAFLRHDESRRGQVELGTALGEVLGLLSAEFGRTGLRVETRLEPGCWVHADKTQLEQVALNLVQNAVDAMEGFPAAERVLSLSVAHAAGGRVVVEVRDAGVGIPAEHLESVFEPLWTTRAKGLGLGLAICRAIVEAHGGTIRAERNAARGATFRFELAAEAGPAADATQAVAPQAPRAEPVAAGPVVCVIDDDAAVRESLARLLRAEGWAVARYASAVEFLERPPPAGIGCILLDHQMPGLSGLELQQQLAHDPAAPPVVFLTGHGDVASGVHAMKLGAVDFLAKPVDAGVLSAAVRKALARGAAEKARSGERDAHLARLARLSAREREVMAHVLRGRLNKQIATDLDIALQTVKQHRARVMEKMEVRSVAELVRACDAAGALPARTGTGR